MLNANETQAVLERFFNDCFSFWLRHHGFDERKAFEFAVDDVKDLKCDPFVPCGKELDVEAKEKFIKYREMDLGR